MDALLGAAALGDIGKHFPPGDPQYKGVSSLVLLGKVAYMLKQAGYRVGNVDATIVAEQPKLAPHIDAMRAALARRSHRLHPPATSAYRPAPRRNWGSWGREEGMVAWAVALIEKI